MDRSIDERNASWRGESNRNAWDRERDGWQQRDIWRQRSGSEVDRHAPGAAAPGHQGMFREGWGNTGGFSESFYNRGLSPYEPGVGGLEPIESHWPPQPPRGWKSAPPGEWSTAAVEAERDRARDDRAWSRPGSWWGNAPANWSNQHAGIAETTWGGGGHAGRYERDWGEAPSSWSRGAGAREWGSQPDWSWPNAAIDGPYRGRGPLGYKRSDERIREDICDLLTESGDIDASGVQVRVENREVTLEGTVPDRRMKRAAEDIAESTRGVRDVHNRLRVESDRGDASSWRDDAWSSGNRAAARDIPKASARSSGAAGSGRGNASARAGRGASSRAPGRRSRAPASRSASGASSPRDRDPGTQNTRAGRNR